MGHLGPTGLCSSQSKLVHLHRLKTFLAMTPHLAALAVKLESLLTVDLTVPLQLNKPRFSPLHVHGFLELELNR